MGSDPNGANAYTECLKAKVVSMHEMYAAVNAATKNQVSVIIVWTSTGEGPSNAAPDKSTGYSSSVVLHATCTGYTCSSREAG